MIPYGKQNISEEDIKKVGGTRINFREERISGDFGDFSKSVSEDEQKSFIGWPPAEGDEITKNIVSSLLDQKSFNFMITDLHEILVEMIEGIREKGQRVMGGNKMSSNEIKEAFDEW